jgi:hypothetical protein
LDNGFSLENRVASSEVDDSEITLLQKQLVAAARAVNMLNQKVEQLQSEIDSSKEKEQTLIRKLKETAKKA